MTAPAVKRAERAVVLYDAECPGGYDAAWFDPVHWERRGARRHSLTGRGGVLMLDCGGERLVLRHYQRGGLVARLVFDHYLWLGLERTRAFREWRLLAQLHGEGFPVPRPVAARVVREGPLYRADIVTELLPEARALSAHIAEGGPEPERWRSVGRMIRAFHERGVDHPDLTAHNILLDGRGSFLVDFDNAVLREPGRWRARGIRRLERSLRKVALETGTEFDAAGWALLVEAYSGGA